MPDRAHILVVDDDPKVRLLLKRCFEAEGYRVTETDGGEHTLASLRTEKVDLITLDLGLGNEDGLMVARQIRAESDVPIIMVTGKGDMVDRVVGLELGADDYISKPFHVREVLARVRSVIRRARSAPQADAAPAPASAGRFTFDRWTADFSTFELHTRDGRSCELTSGEFKLLEVFVRHPKQVMSRDQLMDHLKGYDWTPNDRSIDNQIVRLRKKIEADPHKPKLIKTVRGMGYSFTADVRRA